MHSSNKFDTYPALGNERELTYYYSLIIKTNPHSKSALLSAHSLVIIFLFFLSYLFNLFFSNIVQSIIAMKQLGTQNLIHFGIASYN